MKTRNRFFNKQSSKKKKFFSWSNWIKGILLSLSFSLLGYISMVLIQNTNSTLSWIVSVLALIFVPLIYSSIVRELYDVK